MLRYTGSSEELHSQLHSADHGWAARLTAAGCPSVCVTVLNDVRRKLLWFVKKMSQDCRESCVCRTCGTTKYLVNRLRSFTGNADLTVAKIVEAACCTYSDIALHKVDGEVVRQTRLPPASCLSGACENCRSKRTADHLIPMTAAQKATQIRYTTYGRVSEIQVKAGVEEIVKKWREVQKEATAGEVAEILVAHLSSEYLAHRQRVIWQYHTTTQIRQNSFRTVV